MMHKIALVTGATGFVGRALVPVLRARGWRVRAALRVPAAGEWDEAVAVGDLSGPVDWGSALAGVDTVFHLAARVHQLQDSAPDPQTAYRQVNTLGTAALASAAASCVRRFVFLSSIKVHGESTALGAPFKAADIPVPCDPYGVSKRDAEIGVLGTAGLESVILRPPLVYGPGVEANFARMMHALMRGAWLPLGGIHNRRSLIYVGNLVDALCIAADVPGVVGRAFPLCDGAAVSTPQLLSALGVALGRPARLLPLPVGILCGGLRLIGRQAEAERLLGSLEIDDSDWRRASGWAPPYSLQAGLAETARAFLATWSS